MRFHETPLPGAFVIELEPIRDERGFFARSFCVEEFARAGLDPRVVQCNISYNERDRTLRGLHYQEAPHGETKVVRCVRGAAFDVIVDLRRSSPTYRRWFATELSDENRRALYVPKGFAHGFLTLTNGVEIHYLMSEMHHPPAAAGVRYDDPAFGIEWPAKPRLVSDRDLAYTRFVP